MSSRDRKADPSPDGLHRVPPELLRIKMYVPNHLRVHWQGNIVLGIAQSFFDQGVDMEVWVRSADASALRSYVKEGAPGLLHKVLYKLRQAQFVERLTERRFLDSLRQNDIVYTWPTVSLELLQRVKDRGHVILLEEINCSPKTRQRIFADAYLRLGVQPPISDWESRIQQAQSRISLADGIFTAHRLSTESYVESGVSQDLILESSYGWEPETFRGTRQALPPSEGLTVLFVGTPSVRKGVHLLLEAWDRAKIPGRLVVVGGRPEPIISERYPQYVNHPTVHWLEWSTEIGDYYRSADVFAFPSLEEGGPLVIYEAMGCGLPAVASPMGGGAIGWEKEGIIILDPYDVDAWAETFRRLNADEAYRRELANHARQAAQRFTWEQVGLQRLAQLMTLCDRIRPSISPS